MKLPLLSDIFAQLHAFGFWSVDDLQLPEGYSSWLEGFEPEGSDEPEKIYSSLHYFSCDDFGIMALEHSDDPLTQDVTAYTFNLFWLGDASESSDCETVRLVYVGIFNDRDEIIVEPFSTEIGCVDLATGVRLISAICGFLKVFVPC